MVWRQLIDKNQHLICEGFNRHPRFQMLSYSMAVIEAMESGKSPWDMMSSLLNRDQTELQARFSGPEEDVWRILFSLASAADRGRKGSLRSI